MFQAFSRLLREGEKRTVVIDTAPSGHTLLLLDRTGSYHRDVMRGSASVQGRITTPLMRIQDSTYTRVLLVTLAEATPVQEAAELQADLQRAGIEPYGWVINASLSRSGTRDPVLARRAVLEHRHIRRVQTELAARTWLLPWLADPQPRRRSPNRCDDRPAPMPKARPLGVVDPVDRRAVGFEPDRYNYLGGR